MTIENITDETESTAIDVLPPARPVEMGAISTLREHVGAMQDAKFFAEGMCFTSIVPQRFQGKPSEGAAAILFGGELGLSPIASLRSIIVIHGMPGMEARTMKALLKAKGYRFNTVEASDSVFEIEAWSPDGQEHEVARWTIEDCRREGWVPEPTANSKLRPNEKSDWVCSERNGKTSVVGNMKYITSPRTMLKAKATAEVCRDIAPHILLGMPYSSEELESFDEPVRIEPRKRVPAARRGVEGLRAAIATAPVIEPEIIGDEAEDDEDDYEPDAAKVSGMAPSTRAKWIKRLHDLFTEADAAPVDQPLLMRELLVLDHTPDTAHVLTDDQLRELVNLLNAMSKDGTLGDRINDIINAAVLREAGAAE